MRYVRELIILLISGVITTSIAQPFNISGKVVDQKDQSPLIGANITIPHTLLGTTTNLQGDFQLLLDFKPDTLVVSYIGYQSETIALTNIFTHDSISLTISLREKPLEMKAIVIEESIPSSRPSIAYHRIDQNSLKNIPPLIEPDIFHSLDFVPGIQRIGDWKANLSFEGNAPYQSGVFINGVRVYNPFHFFGVGSSLNPAIAKSVEIYSSGSPVSFGEVTGGLVNLEGANYSSTSQSMLTLSAFNLSYYFNKLFRQKFGIQLGVRKTYFDIISKLIQPIPYGNVDFNIRTMAILPKNIVGEFQFNASNDYFTQKPELSFSDSKSSSSFLQDLYKGEYNFGYYVASVKLLKEYNTNILSLTASTTNDYIDFDEFIQTKFYNHTIRLNYDHTITPHSILQSGLFFESVNFNYFWQTGERDLREIYPPSVIAMDSTNNTFFYGFFTQFSFNKNNYNYQFGIRINKYAQSIAVNPNFTINFQLNSRFRFSFNSGIYSQITASPFPTRELSIKSPYFILNKPIRTLQFGAGIRGQINPAKKLEMRLYHHRSTQVPYWDGVYQQFIPNLKTAITGASILLTDSKGLITYQLMYNFNYGVGLFNNKWQKLDWIIPHSFKGTWGLRIKNGWYFNITTLIKSGNYYTPIIAIYNGLRDDNAIYPGPRLIYGERNSEKFPTYLRTDLSVRRKFFRKRFNYTLFIQVINVFNRKNIYRINWLDYWRYAQLSSKQLQGVTFGFPIIPSIGIEFEFK